MLLPTPPRPQLLVPVIAIERKPNTSGPLRTSIEASENPLSKSAHASRLAAPVRWPVEVISALDLPVIAIDVLDVSSHGRAIIGLDGTGCGTCYTGGGCGGDRPGVGRDVGGAGAGGGVVIVWAVVVAAEEEGQGRPSPEARHIGYVMSRCVR